MSSNSRRIQKELMEIQRDFQMSQDKQIYLKSVTTQPNVFVARIKGPLLTPYETGRFYLRIQLQADYPASPPQVKFITHVWHPNIHPVQGLICLDILAEKWSPALSLRTTLLSIQALLSAPEPNDPLAISVGIQCKNNPEEYELTAKFWTYIYAKGQYQVYEYQEKLATLMSMGVEQILALKILSSCHWNLEEAIETFRNLNHIHYVIN